MLRKKSSVHRCGTIVAMLLVCGNAYAQNLNDMTKQQRDYWNRTLPSQAPSQPTYNNSTPYQPMPYQPTNPKSTEAGTASNKSNSPHTDLSGQIRNLQDACCK